MPSQTRDMIGGPHPPRSPYGRAAGIAAALPTLLLLVACDGVMSPELEFAAAQQAVERWVEQHPNAWSFDLRTSRSLTRPEWSEPCAGDPDSGFTTLRHVAVGTEIDPMFRCPELPPGIRSTGWRFRVLTPSSHVEETVTLSSPIAGRLLVEIETPLFAVYGHSDRQACEPMVDGPSREGCFLLREHRVPLNLSLEVPLPGSLED